MSANVCSGIIKGDRKMKFMSFDFWQKFGKALLVVVAVMPAAGIMISLGKLVGMMGGDMAFVHTIAVILEEIGWGIIGNLHVLFAVAIGQKNALVEPLQH